MYDIQKVYMSKVYTYKRYKILYIGNDMSER